MKINQKYSNPQSNFSLNQKYIQSITEDHVLSLRKKNKLKLFEKYISQPDDSLWSINLNEFQNQIQNEPLYLSFINSNNLKEKLNILFQMILKKENENLLKFSLSNFKTFLMETNKKTFIEQKLNQDFNDNFIQYLFDLLSNNKNNDTFIWHISYIIIKLFSLTNEEEIYCNVLLNNFNTFKYIIKNSKNVQIKNILFTLSNKIFLGSTELLKKFETRNQDYAEFVVSELLNLDKEENNYSKNIYYTSTLISIFSNIFYFKLFSNFMFEPLIEIQMFNAATIIIFIKDILQCYYDQKIFEQSLYCIQNFLYCFISDENLSKKITIKMNLQKFLTNQFNIASLLIPLLYQENKNIFDNHIQIISLKILVNCCWICDKEFCEILIENNIAIQIEKIEKFLLKEIKCSIDKQKLLCKIFRKLVDLILNIMNNHTKNIIYNFLIEHQCIGFLIKLGGIPEYSKERKKELVDIFDLIINSKLNFVQTKLISEGICEFYKNILENNSDEDLIKMIIIDFVIMINYNQSLNNVDSKSNIIILHLEKIGVLDIVNNLKGRQDLSEEVYGIINEFISFFNK